MTEEMKDDERLEQVLRGISVRGVLDLTWQWETQGFDSPYTGALVGWFIRVTFHRPDRVTGEFARGHGRWWVVEYGSTKSAVVKTAFTAMKMIVEHELMEGFMWQGVRIFDPHHTVDQLAQVNQ